MEKIVVIQDNIDSKQSKYVKWLNSTKTNDLTYMGAKSANLSILMQAGFPVPDAFCVTVNAFMDFMENIGCEKGNKENIEISKRILSAQISGELKSAILASYRLLKKKYGDKILIAVRSSALDEDSGQASYAGQYNSTLNVKAEDDLLEAVKLCWSSYFSARALVYRAKISKQNELAMAVLVQLMVPAEFSGVIFTVNPLNKSGRYLTMEMTKGLGDKLVSGEKTGDHVLVDKRTLKIVSFNKQRKHTELKSFDSLKDIDFKNLFKLAVKIEKLMKSPQDIEWAYAKERFWILQSRPITFFSVSNKHEIWSRANAGEILPDVVTPLTWSIFKPVLQLAGFFMSKSMLTLHWNWKHVNDKFPDSPKLFNGKAYMELTSVFAGFGSFPGVTPEILQKMLGFEFNLLQKEEMPLRCFRWHIMDIYRGIRYWLETLNITCSIVRKSERFTKGKKQEINCLKNDAGELLKTIKVLLADTAEVLGLHVQSTAMTFSAFGLIDSLVKKYIEPEAAQLFESALISDFNSISTVQQNIKIWELAQKIKNNHEIKKLIFKGHSMEDVLYSLRMCPSAGDIVKLWDEFIAQFGERSTQEFELAIAHWDEEACFILQMIRDVIVSDAKNPREKLEQQQCVCNDIINKILLRIKAKTASFDAWYFRRLLQFYRAGIPLRENLKYCVVAKFNLLRKIFLKLGLILKSKSMLLEPNDIFFLEYEEVRRVFDDFPAPELDIKSIVIMRKKQYDQNKHGLHPVVFFLRNEEIIPVTTHQGAEGDVLCGIGCSYGQFTGPAYVLDSVLNNVDILSGHILVAPSIDPGLTPLFLTASGLVTEVGF
ncbi:MAG: hypothetical protein HY810_05465 [Candidatus Omnitrophica bacterium]|nr:hypothetical protein [Candidatus Omnitrophota bacterium]